LLQEYKSKFPSWVNDSKYHDLCLTDDIDSLLSCSFLNYLRGYKINYFYNFRAIGHIEENSNPAIAVDMDIVKGKAWGNHVVMLNYEDSINEKCANLNAISKINRRNYFDKFCGSTLIQIMSYYDFDISQLSHEALMVLCCIDGLYFPFFPWKIDFRPTQRKWLQILEYPELIEIMESHKKSDFEEIKMKYNLDSKIITSKGYLNSEIDLESISKLFDMPVTLPNDNFKLLREFESCTKSLQKQNYLVKKDDIDSNIFSLAVTGRDYLSYSIN